MPAPRSLSWICLAAWLCLALAPAATALDSRKYLLEYIHGERDSTSGLPHDSVRAITQDTNGWLWIGTESGLARFDGVDFKVFNSSNTPALKVDRIDTLYRARDGGLWIGARGMIVHHRDGFFTRLDLPPSLRHQFVTSFAEDRSGRLWIGGSSNVFTLSPDNRPEPVPGLPAPVMAVRCICPDVDGSMWVGTQNDGVVNIRGNDTTWFRPDEGGFGWDICGIAADPAGGVHVARRTGEFYRIRNGGVENDGSTRGSFPDLIESIIVDRSGVVWAGSSTGHLFRFKEGQRIPAEENVKFPDDTFNALFEDQEGTIWIGGQRTGLHSLKDSNVALPDLHYLLGVANVRCLLQATNGTLWFGLDNGIGWFQNGRVVRAPALDALVEKPVFSLAQSRDQTVWIGTTGNGLYTYTSGDGRPKPFALPGNSASFDVRAILETQDGAMWIGTRSNGLFRVLTRDGSTLPMHYNTGTNEVRYLHQDRSGALWVALHMGGLRKLVNVNDGLFDPAPGNPALAGFEGRSIYEDDDGTLWFGGHKTGLLRLRGTNWFHFPLTNNFPDRTVHQILADNRGNLWLSSDQTIVSVKKEDLQKYSATEIDRIPFLDLTRESAVRFGGCNGGSQAPGCYGLDGRLWFATRKGPLMVDAGHWQTNFPRPLALIEEVIMDRKSYSAARPVTFPPGNGGALFRYTAFGSIDPAKIRFQHRLVGVDEDWVEPDTSRSVPYPRIPPGSHRFLVRAASQPGAWGPEASFAFELLPHFYQRWWFKVLCGQAVIAAITYGTWLRWRILRRELQLRQETAVEQERSRIARDIVGSPGTELEFAL